MIYDRATLLIVLMAYLIGGILSSVLIHRLFGLPDPRAIGSGNPGATNTLRSTGKRLGFIVFLLDAAKAIVAVLLAMSFTSSFVATWVFAAVVLGHLFPPFFGFRGGKGVACFFGGLLVLSPAAWLIFVVTWLVVMGIAHIVSLASLSALIVTAGSVFFLLPQQAGVIIGICLLILYQHRSNIKRLYSGHEAPLDLGPDN